MRTLNELNTKDSFSTKVSFSNSYKLLIGALALVFVAGMANSAYALTIDSFDVGDTDLTATNGASNSTTVGPLDPIEVIGGERFTNVTHQDGKDQVVMANTKLLLGEDVMAFDSDAATTGLFQLRYDNNTVGLGGVDLTLGGAGDRIIIDFVDAEGGGNFTIIIMDNSTNTSTLSKITSVGLPPNPHVLTYLFTDFVGSADFTKVDKIEVDAQGSGGGDYIIDLIGVPQTRIGGTFGSMDTATLLVAGAQANMGLWSLALVGAVAAGAAITYKLKSNKTKQ